MPVTQSTPRRTGLWVFLAILLIAVTAGLSIAWWTYQSALEYDARTTVVWISIDGLRGDYVTQPNLPFFERLKREAVWSSHLVPVFPSITFPSHCSQATGVTIERHGITGNAFYDTVTKQQYSYPNDASLLQAEPIWLTAQRQGVPTAVIDWPLSHAQKGPIKPVIFGEKFDGATPDDQRLERLASAWEAEIAKPGAKPLLLVMGYIIATDKPGHANGPDSPEIRETMKATDALLAKFTERARTIWRKQRRSPKDRLLFLFTADHGMSTVTSLVSLGRLLDIPRNDPAVRLTTVGNVGHIFLDSAQFPAGSDARRERLKQLRDRALGPEGRFRAVLREEAPKEWGYSHPTRCGDIIIVLPKGYTFSWNAGEQAVWPIGAGGNEPHGMHGYDPRENPEMMGFFAAWDASQNPPKGREVAEVTWDQLHPTVAKLLRVLPAPGAKGTALALDPPGR